MTKETIIDNMIQVGKMLSRGELEMSSAREDIKDLMGKFNEWHKLSETPPAFESLNCITMPDQLRCACFWSRKNFLSAETGEIINPTHWQFASPAPNESN